MQNLDREHGEHRFRQNVTFQQNSHCLMPERVNRMTDQISPMTEKINLATRT